MANHKSAKKRIIRNANRALINGARISRIRTFVKKLKLRLLWRRHCRPRSSARGTAGITTRCIARRSAQEHSFP